MHISAIIDRFRPALGSFEAFYQDIHQYPDLSRHEGRTASRVARQLRRLGFPDVYENIGGHGVVGVLFNGPGRTVMLRAELDALPIREQTGLSYASSECVQDENGDWVAVMHACGHDLHMACLLAAAKLLFDARAEWSGNLVVLFQPDSVHLNGARAMVGDNLYDGVPKPDVIMTQHLGPSRSGTVGISGDTVVPSADHIDIRIFTSKGHAANPQVAVNGVAAACGIASQLEDLAQRVGGGLDASVEVEEIRGRAPRPDEADHVDLALVVRAVDPAVRQRLFEGIERLALDQCAAAGAHREPQISRHAWPPAMENDKRLAASVRQAFVQHFGAKRVLDGAPCPRCVDSSMLSPEPPDARNLLWFLGQADPHAFRSARKAGRLLDAVPLEHSPLYAPVVHPTLETGLEALVVAVLLFLSWAR